VYRSGVRITIKSSSKRKWFLFANPAEREYSRMRIQVKLQTLLSRLTLLLLIFTLPSLAQAQDVLLRNGRLIIGDGSVIENGSVLIRDGLITLVSENEVAVDQNTEVIDVTGKTLIPALIDSHAHLGYQSSSSWGADNYSLETIISNLEQYAYYGFSAVFSAGTDPLDFALSIQEKQTNNQIAGARFLFAAGMGPPDQGPNNQFLSQIASVEARMNTHVLRGLSSPLDAINSAREVEMLGVPFIKLWIDDRGGSQEKLHPDIYKPLIAEAQRLRIKTVIHQQDTKDMLEQIDAGAAGFLHGRLEQDFNQEIAEASRLNRVFIVPNLGLAELRSLPVGREPFLQAILSPVAQQRLSERQPISEQRQEASTQLESTLRNAFSLITAEQVDVILGTDAGAIPDHPFGYTGHKELEIYVRLGYSPMQALLAGTSLAAKHLNLNDLGLLTAGYSADLLVLSANPLDLITNTQLIERVILRGKQVDRDAIAAKLKAM
jgi:imidazolonepropionase-like amidohydrolase